MPHTDANIDKLYYSMGEVTKMFKVNASQIRFYEKEFDILKPKKTKKGNRLFRRSEERRVGKECRSRRSAYQYKKKEKIANGWTSSADMGEKDLRTNLRLASVNCWI